MNKEEYKDAILSAGITVFSKLTVAWLKTTFPFFNFPVISQLTDLFVQKVYEIGFKFTEMGVYFLRVDLGVSKQSREFEQSALHNYEIKKIGTKEEIRDAEKNLIDKARIFIKFST